MVKVYELKSLSKNALKKELLYDTLKHSLTCSIIGQTREQNESKAQREKGEIPTIEKN